MRQDELESLLGDLWPLVGPYANEVVGGHWPQADEDACFDRSGALAAAAKALAGVARDGDVTHAAVTACMDGAAAENFTAHWTRFTTRDPQLIPAASAACERAAGRLHRYGADVEYAKYLMAGVLAALAHRIARLRAMGPASFGGTLGLIPEACTAGRITVQRLAATLVTLQADDARPAAWDGAGTVHSLAAAGEHAGEPLDDALAAGYVPPRTYGPDVAGHPFGDAYAGPAGLAVNARTPDFHHLGGIDWHAGTPARPHGTAGHAAGATPPPHAPAPHAPPATGADVVSSPGDGGQEGTRINDLLNGAPGDRTALASASGPDPSGSGSSEPGGDGHDHGDDTGAQATASPPPSSPLMPMFMPVMPMMPSAPAAGGSPKPTLKFGRGTRTARGSGSDAGRAAASTAGQNGTGGRTGVRGATAGRGTARKRATGRKSTAHRGAATKGAGKSATRRSATGKGTAGEGPGTGAARHGTTGRGTAGREVPHRDAVGGNGGTAGREPAAADSDARGSDTTGRTGGGTHATDRAGQSIGPHSRNTGRAGQDVGPAGQDAGLAGRGGGPGAGSAVRNAAPDAGDGARRTERRPPERDG